MLAKAIGCWLRETKLSDLRDLATDPSRAVRSLHGILRKIKRAASWRLRNLRWSLYRALPSFIRDSFFGRALRDPYSIIKGIRRRLNGRASDTDDVQRKTVIWFGHHGSGHGRYGMIVLADLADDLVRVNRDIPLRLLVVSDNRDKFEELFGALPFKAEFRYWHPLRIFGDIRSADVCVVPNSRDIFSITKSANRAVLALSLGVPVVATRVPATAPLEGCVVFDDWETGLRRYLATPEAASADIEAATRLIERDYSSRAIGEAWCRILSLGEMQPDQPLDRDHAGSPYRTAL
jgi:hypothetical protein